MYFVGIVPRSNSSSDQEDYVIKMKKPQIQLSVNSEENHQASTLHANNLASYFEISLYVAPGIHYYYFLVDGTVRFSTDHPTTTIMHNG